MDITAADGGSVSVLVTDADGTEVGSFQLDSHSTDDTTDGLTATGTSGEWTIEVTVLDFSGDGSLNINSAGAGS